MDLSTTVFSQLEEFQGEFICAAPAKQVPARRLRCASTRQPTPKECSAANNTQSDYLFAVILENGCARMGMAFKSLAAEQLEKHRAVQN
jgi:hypothetical protein